MRRQRKEGEERSERCVLGDQSGRNQPGHLWSRPGLFCWAVSHVADETEEVWEGQLTHPRPVVKQGTDHWLTHPRLGDVWSFSRWLPLPAALRDIGPCPQMTQRHPIATSILGPLKEINSKTRMGRLGERRWQESENPFERKRQFSMSLSGSFNSCRYHCCFIDIYNNR